MKRFKRTLALSMLLILALSTSVFAGYTSGRTSGGASGIQKYCEGWCDWNWSKTKALAATVTECDGMAYATGKIYYTGGGYVGMDSVSATGQVATPYRSVPSGKYIVRITGSHRVTSTDYGNWSGYSNYTL